MRFKIGKYLQKSICMCIILKTTLNVKICSQFIVSFILNYFLQMAKKCKVNGKNSSYPILQVINNCKLVHTFNRCIALFSFYICTYVYTVMCMFTFVFVRGAIFRYLFSRQQRVLRQQLQWNWQALFILNSHIYYLYIYTPMFIWHMEISKIIFANIPMYT